MSDATPLSVNEFHLDLASQLFDHVLALLNRKDRNCAENDRMLHAAHAARLHWDFGGEPVNIALGEWQCARVHTEMRQPEAALHHALRYLELTERHHLGAFHTAYAHLALAGVFSLKGESATEERHLELARALAPQVEGDGERRLLERELGSSATEAGRGSLG